jgi:hypothetical protein
MMLTGSFEHTRLVGLYCLLAGLMKTCWLTFIRVFLVLPDTHMHALRAHAHAHARTDAFTFVLILHR